MSALAGLLLAVTAQAHAAEIQTAQRFLHENLASVPREMIDSPFEVTDYGSYVQLRNDAGTIAVNRNGSITSFRTQSNLPGKPKLVTESSALATVMKAYRSARKGAVLVIYSVRFEAQAHRWVFQGRQTARGIPFTFESADFSVDSQTGLVKTAQIARLPEIPKGPIPAFDTDTAILSAKKAIRNRFGSFELTFARPPRLEILTLPSVPENPVIRSWMFFDLDEGLKEARFDDQGVFAALLSFHDRRGIYYHAFVNPTNHRTIFILEQAPT